MNKKRRALALMLAVCILFAFLFSSFFIASKADHDCIGEQCAICAQIGVFEKTLRLFGAAFPAATVLLALRIFTSTCVFTSAENEANSLTLIKLKVKLSD